MWRYDSLVIVLGIFIGIGGGAIAFYFSRNFLIAMGRHCHSCRQRGPVYHAAPPLGTNPRRWRLSIGPC